jgi:diketogulonate reductase-like aldo/keto reductase
MTSAREFSNSKLIKAS